jgi:hypothetical protein
MPGVCSRSGGKHYTCGTMRPIFGNAQTSRPTADNAPASAGIWWKATRSSFQHSYSKSACCVGLDRDNPGERMLRDALDRSISACKNCAAL